MRFCLKSVGGEGDIYLDGSVVTCLSGRGETTGSIQSTHMHASSYTQNLAGDGVTPWFSVKNFILLLFELGFSCVA